MPSERQEILRDYYICCLSRELSLVIRRDVLTGRAKFGVSDDGKELFQVAMAKAYQAGDWRADYYRGHTLLLALDLAKPEDILAQLYADPENDPFSAGRQMVGHHMTPNTNAQGDWIPQLAQVNLSSDISTTGGQMARATGLAYASKVYREAKHLKAPTFSKKGQEVCFCSIGDASTSEGAFWESLNAAGVLQIPLAVTVADDGYGISVPTEYQTIKGSISAALAGFAADENQDGMAIHRVKGWDYPALCEIYTKGIEQVRDEHQPALFHIEELTQPQGHSTSGSHERYKSEERLQWEKEYDCNRQFRLWMLATEIAEEKELIDLETKAKAAIAEARTRAWENFRHPIKALQDKLGQIVQNLAASTAKDQYLKELTQLRTPSRSELLSIARRLQFAYHGQETPELTRFIKEEKQHLQHLYSSHHLSESPKAALRVPMVPATYPEPAVEINGFEVINRFFDRALERIPELYVFGEDVGKIGGVNQGMAGLQEKHGEHRVFDTGIREWTIVGQAIGMAMRGLRPVAEIQYIDYLIYAFSPLSDDAATLRWRSNGLQQAPLIIRTRGHRLEGIWHSGSPMSVLLGGLRGMHLCVPRNMVQAIGMYNTLLQGDDPGIVIECLNGYRLKESLPSNLDTLTVPLGVPETIREGADLTVVTYGSCIRIVAEAAKTLAQMGVDIEIVDVQTLWPFDLEHRISASLRKTNRLLVVDEDVPGGAAAYIMQHILEDQGGYFQLDATPSTLTGTAYRPPYGDDGNYISKPNVEDVVEKVLELIAE
ncbi:MAG: alpha-ketoacid dehydrogenase subunit alpha/beta [Lewinella sp.]|uniref:alpha-ketoacid dehydrogenase subunit alpha/beta n=1 Tax=Lewinella sp. TaxID=2004506 RepID=UPI003D6B4314